MYPIFEWQGLLLRGRETAISGVYSVSVKHNRNLSVLGSFTFSNDRILYMWFLHLRLRIVVRPPLIWLQHFYRILRSKKSIGIKKKCIPRMSKIKCQKRRNEGLFVDLCFIRLGDYSNYLGDLRYGDSPLNSYWRILQNSSKYFPKFQLSGIGVKSETLIQDKDVSSSSNETFFSA